MPHYIILTEEKGQLETGDGIVPFDTEKEAIEYALENDARHDFEVTKVIIAEVIPKYVIKLEPIPYEKSRDKKKTTNRKT